MNGMMNCEKKAKLICYYLPQFHPIPENDEWWGKGFTEWTNVAKAKSLFPGHYQPRIPADLGFYDLRVPETRIAQAKMAKEYGIEGFCYWHYWFAGKRLLERPFNEVLKSGEPDFPFCLGWANESWTGIWHGNSDRTLIEQTYPSEKDEEAHFQSLLEAFFDKRYLTVDGKPLFYIYKPHNLPEANRFVDHWRELATNAGLKGIYFIGESHIPTWNPKENGFDASVPHMGQGFVKLMTNHANLMELLKKKWYYYIYDITNIFSYKDFVKHGTFLLSDEFVQYPCVLSNWDNTPRSGRRGYILSESTPELFRNHLRKAIEQVARRDFDKRLVFIKSWNEWAEGNYLEPDQMFGRGYLESCRDEVRLAE
jgi:lipopolysaccharide biosynthesis protein